MKINKEQKEQIINFGAFEYCDQKMANILEIDVSLIKKQMQHKKSEFYLLYQKGKDRSDYVLDLKLFEMGQRGDIKAIEKLEQRKFKRKNES